MPLLNQVLQGLISLVLKLVLVMGLVLMLRWKRLSPTKGQVTEAAMEVLAVLLHRSLDQCPKRYHGPLYQERQHCCKAHAHLQSAG